MTIIQLSDLHIGGDYDGQYNTRYTFEKTVKAVGKYLDSLPDKQPRGIVVSGDVSDDVQNMAENYKYVDRLLHGVIRQHDNIVYMTGNHDNARIMGETLGFDPDEMSMFTTPAANILIIPTYKGEVELSKMVLDLYGDYDGTYQDDLPLLAFSHFPIGRVQNRFMYSIGGALKNTEAIAKCLHKFGVNDFFCGHFHSPGTTVHDGYRIHVAPSTQCQIDPWAKKFQGVGDYPGFTVITVEDKKVNVEFKFVELGD